MSTTLVPIFDKYLSGNESAIARSDPLQWIPSRSFRGFNTELSAREGATVTSREEAIRSGCSLLVAMLPKLALISANKSARFVMSAQRFRKHLIIMPRSAGSVSTSRS